MAVFVRAVGAWGRGRWSVYLGRAMAQNGHGLNAQYGGGEEKRMLVVCCIAGSVVVVG